jgi:DsbC/DsbD-like thiol-disulfide interchange protein
VKAALFLTGCVVLSWAAFGQEPGPVQWALSVSTAQRPPLSRGAELTARLHASIERGWHIYSLHEQPGGPTPMKISVPPRQPFAISGDISAPQPRSAVDPGFGMETYFYAGEVNLAVPLRVRRRFSGTVAVDVRYQACNRDMCLQPAIAHLAASVMKSSEE